MGMKGDDDGASARSVSGDSKTAARSLDFDSGVRLLEHAGEKRERLVPRICRDDKRALAVLPKPFLNAFV